MTFSVTKSTSNADLAALDNGAAIARGTGKELGPNGQVSDADAPAEGGFAKLFSVLSGAFESSDDAQTFGVEGNVQDITADNREITADNLVDKAEPKSENNDELLSRLAQSSQFLRTENPTSETAAETGGNMLPNAAPFSSQPAFGVITEGESLASGLVAEHVDPDGAEIVETAGNTAEANTLAETEDGSTSASVIAFNANGTSIPVGHTPSQQSQPLQTELGSGFATQTDITTPADVAAELPATSAIESADPEQTIPDAAAVTAAAGQVNAGQLAGDNTNKNERLSETAAGLTEVTTDSISLTQSGSGPSRQTPVADTLPSAAGNAGVNTAQADTEQLDQQDSAALTDAQDFSTVLEQVRGHEQTDPLSRTTKSANLTAAEQQVMDKRVNLHDSRASSELNEKIAVMVNKDMQTATIRLDPAELGSLHIKLVVQNDQANVVIQTQNHHSRDLLDQSMPRLREMLQQQGIALGDSQVQADSGRQQQSNYQQPSYASGQKNSNNTSNPAFDSHSESPVTTQYWQDSAKGVDFYA